MPSKVQVIILVCVLVGLTRAEEERKEQVSSRLFALITHNFLGSTLTFSIITRLIFFQTVRSLCNTFGGCGVGRSLGEENQAKGFRPDVGAQKKPEVKLAKSSRRALRNEDLDAIFNNGLPEGLNDDYNDYSAEN